MKPDQETLVTLYLEEGMSYGEIGQRYGVTRTSVKRWIHAAGITPRTTSEANRLTAGKRVYSEEHKAKLRQNAVIARSKITDESREKWRQKMLGRTPPNKGVPMSEEQRQKLVTQRADPEYRRIQAERFSGENNYNWKGGVKSEESRRLDRAEWRRLRREVYERDGWTCQDCKCRCLNTRDSKPYPKRKIQAHHIIPRRLGGLDELSNLVTLCMSCHHKRERRFGDALIA